MEPYEEVLGGVSLRPEVTVQVTGNVEAHRDSFRTEPPDNVVFTGFVPDADFVTLLRESDCIIDLTTLPDCLVCGAYEATALGVPVILSDTAANREIFIPGAVLASNNARDLARAIREVLRHRREHQAEMQILREHLVRRWEQQFGRFSRWLDGSTL
ncbi:MAG: glycosyltransferase [Pseudomonadota bacterium]